MKSKKRSGCCCKKKRVAAARRHSLCAAAGGRKASLSAARCARRRSRRLFIYLREKMEQKILSAIEKRYGRQCRWRVDTLLVLCDDHWHFLCTRASNACAHLLSDFVGLDFTLGTEFRKPMLWIYFIIDFWSLKSLKCLMLPVWWIILQLSKRRFGLVID